MSVCASGSGLAAALRFLFRSLPFTMITVRCRQPCARFLNRLGQNGSTARIRTLSRPPAVFISAVRTFSAHPPSRNKQEERKTLGRLSETIRENIYTIPNLLTISRILACPILGYTIVQDNFVAATSLLVYAGLTDLVCLSLAWCPHKTVF